MNKKKILIDIIIGFIGLSLILGVFIYLKYKRESSSYDELNSYNISFKVYYDNDELVINDSLKCSDGETLYNVLERYYDIEYREDTIGKAILKIDEYESDWYSSYFALYVDGIYSSYGIEYIKPTKNMEIKLIWTRVE